MCRTHCRHWVEIEERLSFRRVEEGPFERCRPEGRKREEVEVRAHQLLGTRTFSSREINVTHKQASMKDDSSGREQVGPGICAISDSG